MANYSTLNLFTSDKASVAVPVAVATSGGANMIVEQIIGTMTLGTTTILSRIVFSAAGLNKNPTIYFSAQDVPTIITALGATLYKQFSLYRATSNGATSLINVGLPVTGGSGITLETAPTGTNAMVISGVTILSQFVVSHSGLTAGKRYYYSALSVAANAATLG